jgi:hypothetical protein
MTVLTGPIGPSLATRDDLFQKPVLGANVPCGRRTVD